MHSTASILILLFASGLNEVIFPVVRAISESDGILDLRVSEHYELFEEEVRDRSSESVLLSFEILNALIRKFMLF